MRNCRKQNDDWNIIHCKEDVATFQVKEEKLLAKNKKLPDATGNESVKAIDAGEGEENAGDDFADSILRRLYFVRNHPHMQANMQRHKKIIPVTCKQMRNAGKTKSTLNIQECENVVRKNNTAYHKEEGTNQNTAVNDCLHYTVGIVFSLEDCTVPAAVQNNVDSPQKKKSHA